MTDRPIQGKEEVDNTAPTNFQDIFHYLFLFIGPVPIKVMSCLNWLEVGKFRV